MFSTVRGIGRRRIVFATIFALLLVSLMTLPHAIPVAADTGVNIQNFAFQPTPLMITVGMTVTWTNRDSASHTTTSDSGIWNSGPLSNGKSFSFTFNQAGTFAYHCDIHPNMHGMIVVSGNATAMTATTVAPVAPMTTTSASGMQGFATDAFQQLWAKTDANAGGHTYVWGPNPFTGAGMEDYREAPSGKRLVQYFDKGRMELNATNGHVTAGLLTVELITGKEQTGDATFIQRASARVTVAGDPDNAFPTYADLARLQSNEQDLSAGATVMKLYAPDGSFTSYNAASTDPLARVTMYDRATSHNIPKAFADFRANPVYGGLSAIGLAVTEPVWANIKVAGKIVQGFERRVLTYTPSNPNGFEVEYGNIGRAYHTWRSTLVMTTTTMLLSAPMYIAPMHQGVQTNSSYSSADFSSGSDSGGGGHRYDLRSKKTNPQ